MKYIITKNSIVFIELEELTSFEDEVLGAFPGHRFLKFYEEETPFPVVKNYSYEDYSKDFLKRFNNKFNTSSKEVAEYYITMRKNFYSIDEYEMRFDEVVSL